MPSRHTAQEATVERGYICTRPRPMTRASSFADQLAASQRSQSAGMCSRPQSCEIRPRHQAPIPRRHSLQRSDRQTGWCVPSSSRSRNDPADHRMPPGAARLRLACAAFSSTSYRLSSCCRRSRGSLPRALMIRIRSSSGSVKDTKSNRPTAEYPMTSSRYSPSE